MWRRLRERKEWQFFAVLPRADRGLALAWWTVLIVRGLLPAAFAVGMGMLVGAAWRGEPPGTALAVVGAVFVLLQVLAPLHTAIGQNLGSRVAAWLYDRLTEACGRPPGLGHLEDPRLMGDLTVARDFDLGMTGPPMHINLEFIAGGLVDMVGGLASTAVLAAYAWWAPLVLAAGWLSTHWLLRESAVWRDRNTPEVREAHRVAEYDYRLAVDPPAAKELRLFGLADWVVGRFVERRRRLHELQYRATRLRERPMVWSLLLAGGANVAVFGSLAVAAGDRRVDTAALVVFAQAAVGASAIAFGGLNWALDGASAPVAAVARLQPAMAEAGALAPSRRPLPTPDGSPAREIRFRDVTFAYPGSDRPVLVGFDLTIPAGTSLAIVGRNGAGKTTLAKLLCRLYDPQGGAIEVDGVDLRDLDPEAWRSRISAVFQDFVRFELPLRDNVAPDGAPDEVVLAALDQAGARGLAALDTPLARGYRGGTDLSGGQWQRVALARALCAVRRGAGLVLLDEPTAQLDVRGEAEIFDRILAATRQVTTMLISHRFSTVRHADRIAVIEQGRVVELGTHDELTARDSRYRTMFELQARRFDADTDEEGTALDSLA
jgi:ABC-type transport system involved in cytochrome bd biosynthesis fused ATPase/permease subunit